MARTTARVDGATLVIRPDDPHPIPVGTPAWFAWLERATAFAFTSPAGRFTARKEARARGGWYWKAYHTVHGTLHRAYLGKTADLTLDRLNQAAATLADAAVIPKPAPHGPPSTPPPFPAPNLLATKLMVPPTRAQLVVRPRLFDWVTAGLQGKLTLIAAPAGSGKTTLLRAWRAAAGSGIPFAWVSLDAADNDPLLFWSYVLTALDAVAPGTGTAALTLLHAPQPPPMEHMLTSLLNALTPRLLGPPRRDVALVLEDYHVITTPAIHAALAWLLDALPAPLHLVLVTRADPPLPLARLRARGDLTELHADDLRFTPAEGATFLNQIMGLALPADELAALETRTEGWIAGLQLAALALRDHQDRAGFIRTFTGTNRYIVDYLAAEVLERQPPPTQTFLLHTAILDRMCASLCDALLAPPAPGAGSLVDAERPLPSLAAPPTFSHPASQHMLEELERANLFIVPLDEDRHWYRYHHLFADVLRQRLTRSAGSAALATLHERASGWYEEQGLVPEAVQHALLLPDGSRAAQLIEQHGLGVIVGGQVQTALRWLNRLPEDLLRPRPRLCIYYALALLFTNQLAAAEARLQEAERCLRPDTPPAVAQSIQGYAAAIRANIALYTGDLAGCVAYGEQVLALLPETEVIARTTAHLHVARAFRVTGEVTSAAERRAVAAIAPIRATGSLFGTLGAVVNLARLQELQGRLRAAAATYREVDRLAPGPDDLSGLHGSPAYYVGLGELHREWNELDSAEGYLAQAMALLPERQTVDAEDVARGYIALARLQQARGEHATAQGTLTTFADLAQRRGFVPHLITRGAAAQAQLALAAGNLSAAVTWAEASGLHAADAVAFPRAAEYLVLARVWIAQASRPSAGDVLAPVLDLLDRLLADAVAQGRGASVLEILLVQALALAAQGTRPPAQAALGRALTLAAPEGYVRRFVDEGPPLRRLLQDVDAGTAPPGYVPALLAAFATAPAAGSGRPGAFRLPLSAPPPSRAVLPEPLSEREREVLRLIASGQSNAEVARALVIALSTVKTHTNSIFGKLGVTSRTQAVARARELHLI
jgi:LuxR family maltose regulon positive regulatory protein